MSEAKSGPRRGRPWGPVAGLLAACAVTLIGVARDLDPDVVLLRAACAAACCGGAVAAGRFVARRLFLTP